MKKIDINKGGAPVKNTGGGFPFFNPYEGSKLKPPKKGVKPPDKKLKSEQVKIKEKKAY